MRLVEKSIVHFALCDERELQAKYVQHPKYLSTDEPPFIALIVCYSSLINAVPSFFLSASQSWVWMEDYFTLV